MGLRGPWKSWQIPSQTTVHGWANVLDVGPAVNSRLHVKLAYLDFRQEGEGCGVIPVADVNDPDTTQGNPYRRPGPHA